MKYVFFILMIILSSNAVCETKELQVGESFTIDLASNPTTGYSWRCVCTPEENVTVTNKYIRNTEKAGLVGAGGTETFTITAQKAGAVCCVLSYGRSWDEASYGKTQTYQITINK